MTDCKYCADWIGGGKKEMNFHLTYCEYYTVVERGIVLFDSMNEKLITAAKKVLPRLAINYLTLGIKTARYIENTFNKWSAQN